MTLRKKNQKRGTLFVKLQPISGGYTLNGKFKNSSPCYCFNSGGGL